MIKNSQFAKEIRREYGHCCLTTSYGENSCSIGLSGITSADLTTIHGDLNQRCKKHGNPSQLCDRIIFGQLDQEFICAVEIKGGKNSEVSKAIKQIQGGLDLARLIVNNNPVDCWYPLLFFSGKMNATELRLLNTKKVSYNDGKPKSKTVVRIDCGSSLLNFLQKQ